MCWVKVNSIYCQIIFLYIFKHDINNIPVYVKSLGRIYKCKR